MNIHNPKDYIKNGETIIKLINSFIERNKTIRIGNERQENEEQKNIILLKGNIDFHNSVCTNNECPLNKFTNNEGNFNIQRQSLLNFIIYFLIEDLKSFQIMFIYQYYILFSIIAKNII